MTKPGPSFQLKVWACIHFDKYIHIIETAQLIVENSAQTSFRFSPVSFRASRVGPSLTSLFNKFIFL